MGYFSNGDEGDAYEGNVCSRCAHNEQPDGFNICIVWELHLFHNGEEGAVGEMLDRLIPRHNTTNDLCNMWHPSHAQYANHGTDYQKWIRRHDTPTQEPTGGLPLFEVQP